MTTNSETAAGSAEFTMTRVFNAPRDLVWKAWTDPAHAKHWWGPIGFTTTVYESDLRPGGAIVRHMRAPDGTIVRSMGTYEEVVAAERLVSSGQLERPGELPFEVRTTVTFQEHDGKTTVAVHQAYSKMTAAAAAAAVEGARDGWSQAIGRLEAYLESEPLLGRKD
jgi:uncharacterized protein YndB with AHSA1/START domain